MTDKAILIVDDEAILLLSLKHSLRLRFGMAYRYETALSGQEGLDRVEELAKEGVSVVLVISDWLMPGMKGDEFLRILHERNPEIKLIMVTGHADEGKIEKLSDSIRLEALFRKPWDPERLFACIQQSIG